MEISSGSEMLTATQESRWFKWSQYWLFLRLWPHTWPVAALSALAALSKYCISIKCGQQGTFHCDYVQNLLCWINLSSPSIRICLFHTVSTNCSLFPFKWKLQHIQLFWSWLMRCLVAGWTNLNASLVPRVQLYSHKCCGELHWVNSRSWGQYHNDEWVRPRLKTRACGI